MPLTLTRSKGAAVALHVGWLPFLGLIAWIFAAWSAPQLYPEYGPGARWQLGIAVALLALISVGFRELARIAVARRHSLRLKHLALFPYGGVSHFAPAPHSWRVRAALAAVGPLTSLTLVLAFALLWYLTDGPLYGWLAAFNIGLGVLTVLPAQPLDGARLLEAFSHLGAIDPQQVERINRHGGDLLAMSLIWLGGITLLLAQSPPGLLLIALGLLLQYQEQEPALGRNSAQKPLLDHYSVRDVIEDNAGSDPQERREQQPPRRTRGGPAGDGAALPLDRGPSLQHRVVPVTAELSTVWRKLDEQDTDNVLVVEGHSITGVCSRQQLLAYLRSRPTTAQNEQE